MLKTTLLSLGILASGNNQNIAVISNAYNIKQAETNLHSIAMQYLKTHQLNVKQLSKNLKVLYSQEKPTIKNGRNGYKHHWYGFDIWINEETGTKMDQIMSGGGGISDISAILAGIMDTGPFAPIVLGLAGLLMAQWAITWTFVDEGSGIHMSVETLTGVPVIVYAHAQ